MTGAQRDLAGLHLDEEVDEAEREREKERYKERVGLSMKQEELVAKVKGKVSLSCETRWGNGSVGEMRPSSRRSGRID